MSHLRAERGSSIYVDGLLFNDRVLVDAGLLFDAGRLFNAGPFLLDAGVCVIPVGFVFNPYSYPISPTSGP